MRPSNTMRPTLLVFLSATAVAFDGDREAFDDSVSRMLKHLESVINDLMQAKNDSETKCAKEASWSDVAVEAADKDFEKHKSKCLALDASIIRDTADADALAAQIQKDTNTLTEKQAEKDGQNVIRANQNKEFNKKLAEMGEIIATIRSAISSLDTGGVALIQGKPKEAVMKSIPAIKAVLNAVSLSTQSAKKLDALVQESEDSKSALGDDDFGEYQTKSQDVMTLLHKLLTEAQENYAQLKAQEQSDLFEHNHLIQQLNAEITTLTNANAANRQSEAGKRAQVSSDKADLAVASQGKNLAHATLQELTQQDGVKSRSCKEFKDDTTAEINALKEAHTILNNDAVQKASVESYKAQRAAPLAMFMQLSVKYNIHETEEDEARRASAFLQDQSERLGSPVLSQIAEKVGKSKFDFVIRMIEDMVLRLEKQTSAAAYCDQQVNDNSANEQDKEVKVDKLTTQVDKLAAEQAQAKADLADLLASQNDMQKSQTAADANRAAAKLKADATIRNFQATIGAFNKGIESLQKHYSNNPGSNGKQGSRVVDMLQQELTHLKRQVLKFQAKENAEANAHKQMTHTFEANIAGMRKEESLTRKNTVTFAAELAEAQGELKDAQVEVGAIQGTVAAVQKDCDVAKTNDADRARRTEDEKAALQEALAILKGEGM